MQNVWPKNGADDEVKICYHLIRNVSFFTTLADEIMLGFILVDALFFSYERFVHLVCDVNDDADEFLLAGIHLGLRERKFQGRVQ